MSDAFDDESGEYEAAFGSFGEYGVTSAELPAVSPEQWAAWERERARAARELEQRTRRARDQFLDKLDALYDQGRLTLHGYDLLQDEVSAGFLPDLYRGADARTWVFSERERRHWTLAGWNRHALDLVPVSARETARLYVSPPPVLPGYHPAPRLTPLVGLPEATTGAPRPWQAQWDSKLTPPPVMRTTPPVWLFDEKDEER